MMKETMEAKRKRSWKYPMEERFLVKAPRDLVEVADRVAERLGLSRAGLFRLATALFLEREGMWKADNGEKDGQRQDGEEEAKT